MRPAGVLLSQGPILILQDTSEFIYSRTQPGKIGFTKTHSYRPLAAAPARRPSRLPVKNFTPAPQCSGPYGHQIRTSAVFTGWVLKVRRCGRIVSPPVAFNADGGRYALGL
ncbi:hypothetical protein EN789_33660, partial [bacterium M00.F.Ca.ET.146.01.1.1]